MSGFLQDPHHTANKPGVASVAPHNIEAEQLLLGAILLNNTNYELVSEFLKQSHFYDALHGEIYRVVGRLLERGATADPITVRDYLVTEDPDRGEEIKQYLIDISAQVYSVVDVEAYGKIIHELYLRRQLIALGHDVVLDAQKMDLEITAESLIEGTEQRLFNLLDTGQLDKKATDFSEVLKETMEMVEAAKGKGDISGYTTGLKDLDKKLGGLHPSDLLILAGRPSMGKTALAVNIAFNAVKAKTHNKSAGAGVLLFSLEMSAPQLAGRILASEAQISSEKIRRGELTPEAYERLFDISQEMSKMPLFIDDTPALTISAIRTRARRLKRLHNIEMIVIDYLQLLQGSSSRGAENRTNEISEISRGLKAIAKELNVPVIALSQLSRAVESREDKRPQLSDLRESGSIEQDADVVMFVFREEYYLSRLEPNKEASPDKYASWEQKINPVRNLAEVIIAKQRHGPIGTVKLHFNPEITHFGNYDYIYSG